MFFIREEWGFSVECKPRTNTEFIKQEDIFKATALRAFDDCVNGLSETSCVAGTFPWWEMTVRLNGIAGFIGVGCSVPAALFGPERRVCPPLCGLITDLEEEMVAELCKGI